MARADLDSTFGALASAERRRMLDLVETTPGLSIADVSRRFTMSSVGVLKHIRVLEAAGLLHARRDGRRRRLYLNAVPIQHIHDWSARYTGFWSERLADIKERVESRETRKAGRNAG